MRRKTVITGAVAGAILVAVASFLALKVRAVASGAEDAVYRETGLRFSYSGMPSVSFWPDTAVTLGDVVLTAPEGGTPFLTAPQVRLKLDRGLLTSGPAAIASITLTDAQINMITGLDGKPNWVFGDKASAKSGAAEPLPIRLADGRLTYLDERSGFAFSVDEIEADTTLAGPQGEFNAKGGVVWNKQAVNFTLFLKSPQRLAEDGSPIDLNFTSPSLTFALSGRAATAKAFNLTGQATAKSGALRLLSEWFGSKISGDRGLANFEIAGNFEATEKGVVFHQTRLSIDGMHGRGDISLARVNGRPQIDASLGVDRIDLNPYKAPLPRMPPLTLLEGAWPTDTLSFAGLKDVDAQLRLATNQVIYGDLKSGPARATVDLRDGMLNLKLDQVSLYGGAAGLQLKLDSTQAVPALALSFAGTDLDSEPTLRGAMEFGKIAGKLSTSFSVATSGSSVAEMVSRLAGSGSFRITDGSVTDLDLARIIRGVSEAIQDGWPLDPSVATPFDALSASYTIEDGIVATQNMVLTSPALAVTLHGEIDLARQAFDLTSEPRLVSEQKGTRKATTFATFPVPVMVKGPWIGPRIYPDMPGILEDPDAAFRALKKLGLGTATVETSDVPPAN